MKTIFIPIFQGVEARNILRTDIFAKLSKQKDLKIVLFVPSQEKLDYYKKEFSEHKNIRYEIFDNYKSDFWDKLFEKTKVYLLKTDTMDIKRRLKYEQSGNSLRFYVSFAFNRIVARPLLRKIVRWLDYHLVQDDNFKEVFDRHKPDVVFLAHLFGGVEISMLREAKRRGVTSVGFINSWDKLTARCILRILPDHLIVPTEITKTEAIKYHDVNPGTIFVSGPPQFDIYSKITPTDKDVFYKNQKIDPSKKILLLCPVGKAFSDLDWSIVESLNKFIEKKLLINDVHVIVRFPPNDVVEIKDNVNKENFSFIRPGVRFSTERGVDWDMGPEDLQSLVDNIHHSSLAFCFFSTVNIDAAILNKPIINIDFNPIKSDSFYRTPRPLYEMEHYKNILRHDGIRSAKNEEDLVRFINEYLENPSKDSYGRKKIVEQQVGVRDGKAGERVATYLLSL